MVLLGYIIKVAKMKCIPHKSRIEKEASGDFIWYKGNSVIRQSFNDQPALRAISYDFFKWHKNDSLMKIFF